MPALSRRPCRLRMPSGNSIQTRGAGNEETATSQTPGVDCRPHAIPRADIAGSLPKRSRVANAGYSHASFLSNDDKHMAKAWRAEIGYWKSMVKASCAPMTRGALV